MQIQEKVNQRGLDVTSFGAKGDGSNDIGAFEKMLANTNKIKTVYVRMVYMGFLRRLLFHLK